MVSQYTAAAAAPAGSKASHSRGARSELVIAQPVGVVQDDRARIGILVQAGHLVDLVEMVPVVAGGQHPAPLAAAHRDQAVIGTGALQRHQPRRGRHHDRGRVQQVGTQQAERAALPGPGIRGLGMGDEVARGVARLALLGHGAGAVAVRAQCGLRARHQRGIEPRILLGGTARGQALERGQRILVQRLPVADAVEPADRVEHALDDADQYRASDGDGANAVDQVEHGIGHFAAAVRAADGGHRRHVLRRHRRQHARGGPALAMSDQVDLVGAALQLDRAHIGLQRQRTLGIAVERRHRRHIDLRAMGTQHFGDAIPVVEHAGHFRRTGQAVDQHDRVARLRVVAIDGDRGDGCRLRQHGCGGQRRGGACQPAPGFAGLLLRARYGRALPARVVFAVLHLVSSVVGLFMLEAVKAARSVETIKTLADSL
ncbi:hypothetical protein CBM2600_A80166 [Cupriavidus taiwanensis]|nr:hypothetical protein CBM2600_A80166 [Cupriavidus taiwanensis]